jgi:hypothetical protein
MDGFGLIDWRARWIAGFCMLLQSTVDIPAQNFILTEVRIRFAQRRYPHQTSV